MVGLAPVLGTLATSASAAAAILNTANIVACQEHAHVHSPFV